MARITLDALRHSYAANPATDDDWALKQVDLTWDDGGAYALLGPSGCGKTTMLNLISGLLKPTQGSIHFDEQDVTGLPPDQRHIAQVFQFPVVYDTMTVYDNLAFPLRNRGVDEKTVDQRVREVATFIDMTERLQLRAKGLTADGKQKISLGRGLVRTDVNVIMFDEPLTVIDPHLKWELRSKLKELHQKVRLTMIYVTHDQTEALTFADQVVVMNLGEIVQVGTPVDLFEKPQHTFVGHFIGSPGMNVLSCDVSGGKAMLGGMTVETENTANAAAGSKLEIGVRPEFVTFGQGGLPASIVKVSDAGRHRVVETRCANQTVRLLAPEGSEIPSDGAELIFDTSHTRLYADGWMVGAGR